MNNVSVFFRGVLFDCEIECDDDAGCYAMSAIIDGHDWIDSFNTDAENGFHKKLQVALRIQKAEDELERLLSER
jgi:hypothetical protein